MSSFPSNNHIHDGAEWIGTRAKRFSGISYSESSEDKERMRGKNEEERKRRESDA
jgi:hypothetical protein